MTDHTNLVNRLESAFTVYAGKTLSESHLADLCREAATALQSLTSTIAGLEVDSARYRWLRHDAIYCDYIWVVIGDKVNEAFDRMVDAAMSDQMARGKSRIFICKTCSGEGVVHVMMPGTCDDGADLPCPECTAISRARG